MATLNGITSPHVDQQESTTVGLSYGWQKCSSAVSVAAMSKKSLQERLADAYECLIPLKCEDVPPGVWRKLKSLEEVLTTANVVPGKIHASAANLSDEEAREWLDRIVEVYGDVAAARGVAIYKEKQKITGSSSPQTTA